MHRPDNRNFNYHMSKVHAKSENAIGFSKAVAVRSRAFGSISTLQIISGLLLCGFQHVSWSIPLHFTMSLWRSMIGMNSFGLARRSCLRNREKLIASGLIASWQHGYLSANGRWFERWSFFKQKQSGRH